MLYFGQKRSNEMNQLRMMRQNLFWSGETSLSMVFNCVSNVTLRKKEYDEAIDLLWDGLKIMVPLETRYVHDPLVIYVCALS